MSKKENLICDKIEFNSKSLGFSEGSFLREVQLGSGSGYCDMVFIPDDKQEIPYIIEAKRINNPEIKDAVIGQLLLYLTHASEIPIKEWLKYREALNNGLHKGFSINKVFNEPEKQIIDRWKIKDCGRFKTSEIPIIIGVDSWDTELERRLAKILNVMEKHQFRCGLIITEPEVKWYKKP